MQPPGRKASSTGGVLRLSSWTEALGAVGLLALIGILLFRAWLVDGGFMVDDWYLSATYRFGFENNSTGFPKGTVDWASSVGNFLDQFGDRPVLAVFFATEHALFGLDETLYVGVSIAVAVAASGAFFAFLRLLGFPFGHALILSILALVFPYCDTTRVWATGVQSTLALLFFLVAASVALLGLRRIGRRAWVWHAVAVFGYALSVLTYQLTVGVVAFMAIAYLAVADRRRALTRSAVDLLVVLPIALISASQSIKPGGPVNADRLWEVYSRAAAILTSAARPTAYPSSDVGQHLVVLLPLVALVVVAVVVALTRRRADTELRRWLLVGGAAAVWIALSYAAIVPTKGYVPTPEGIGNRLNVVASLGHVTLVYSALMVLGLLVFRRARHAAVAAAAVAGVYMLAYVHAGRVHTNDWLNAKAESERVVASVRSQDASVLRRGNTLFTVGHATNYHGVPVFIAHWDLDTAVKVTTDDPRLRAIPLIAATSVVCGPRAMAAAPWEELTRSPYGHAYLVDVHNGHASPVDGIERCRAVAAQVIREKSP